MRECRTSLLSSQCGVRLICHSNVSVGGTDVARNESQLSVFRTPQYCIYSFTKWMPSLRLPGGGIMNVVWWNKDPGRLVAVVVLWWARGGSGYLGLLTTLGIYFPQGVKERPPG